MQACTVASSQTVLIASGRPFRPSQTAMQTSSDAAVLQVGQHCQPELRALAAVAGPATDNAQRLPLLR